MLRLLNPIILAGFLYELWRCSPPCPRLRRMARVLVLASVFALGYWWHAPVDTPLLAPPAPVATHPLALLPEGGQCVAGDITMASDTVLSNIVVYSPTGRGLVIPDGVDRVMIRNSVFEGCGVTIGKGATRVTFMDNYFHIPHKED